MRILFLTFQLCVAGVLYLLVAVPLLIAVSGIVYALVVAIDYVIAAIAMGLMEALISVLPPLFPSMSGSAGGAPLLFTVGGAISQAATVLAVVAAPLLLALLVNLVCVFLANYRDWFARMRRVAIIANFAALGCYLLPQLVLIGAMVHDACTSTDAGPSATPGAILLVAFVALAWDAYFFISITLLYRMPKRPDVQAAIKRLPAAQTVLSVAMLALFALLLLIIGAALGRFLIVVVCLICGLATLLLLANARAARRIAARKGKLLALLLLLANLLAALFCLVFIPPVGVLLFLGTAFLYFLLEGVFFGGKEDASASEPDRLPEAGATL